MEEVTRVSMDAFQLTGTRDEAGLLINSLRSLSVCAYKTLVIIISFPSLTSHRHPAPANYFLLLHRVLYDCAAGPPLYDPHPLVYE